MKMDLTAILGDDVLTQRMIRRLEQDSKKEIERAIDKIKFGIPGQRTRDQKDKWIRHLWYRAAAIRCRDRVGPTVTED
jgi:hypothetical protein